MQLFLNPVSVGINNKNAAGWKRRGIEHNVEYSVLTFVIFDVAAQQQAKPQELQISSWIGVYSNTFNATSGVCHKILLSGLAYLNSASFHFLCKMGFCLYSVVSSCVAQNHTGAHFQSLISFFSGLGGCFAVVLLLPRPALLLALLLCTWPYKHQCCSDWIQDDRTDCWPGFCLLMNTYRDVGKKKTTEFCTSPVLLSVNLSL